MEKEPTNISLWATVLLVLCMLAGLAWFVNTNDVSTSEINLNQDAPAQPAAGEADPESSEQQVAEQAQQEQDKSALLDLEAEMRQEEARQADLRAQQEAQAGQSFETVVEVSSEEN